MDREIKIRAQLVTKEYSLFSKQSDKLKSLFSLKKPRTFWALRGVSFTACAGDTIGIIGVNGSGKSTLSNVISGIIPATSGNLDIQGDVSIISIGAGLKGELTGEENIFLKGLMSGMSNKEIKNKLTEIIEFADIGEFIHQPVKNYSSGMKARLGFAIAVHQNMDILVIDEALAVGDDTFYQKCVEKMMSLKDQGKTILFVSHSLGQVQKLCEKTMWLHYGELKQFGNTSEVIEKYKEFTKEFKGMNSSEKKKYQSAMKKNQQEFSLEGLRNRKIEESIKSSEVFSRKKIKKINKVVEKNPVGDKMTGGTKLLLSMLTIILLFLCIVSFNDNAISGIINHPIEFINKQFMDLFKESKEKDSSKKDDNEQIKDVSSEKSSEEVSQVSTTQESSITNPSEEIATKNDSYSYLTEYTVQPGDTLEGIAQLHQIPVEILKNANNLTRDEVSSGETLYIPWIGGEEQ